MIDFLSISALRPKVIRSIDQYLSLSERQSLTIGFYRDGDLFVMGNAEDPTALFYDIGSISKTMTAHLILSLAQSDRIDLYKSVSDYLDLPPGRYPTIYELLTHSAGYGHLTPIEITVPALLRHGYARRNIYENCTSQTVLECLKRRRNKKVRDYSYSDFSYAVLAVVAEKVTGRSFAELFERFVREDLKMKDTVITAFAHSRQPPSALGKRTVGFWKWKPDNPYIAGGGLVSNIRDMLTYIALQIESDVPYITAAHTISERSALSDKKLAACMGWHTYKKSNQLWHVGGVGTFRSSVILNKKRKIGVVVLGNSKGVASANVHYLAKMLYSEMKIHKIDFKR